MTAQELDVGAIGLDLALLAELDVLLATDRSETPVLGDDDLLATGEFIHGAAQSLDGGGTVAITGAYGEKDLSDVHTRNATIRLTEGTAHTGLETIGSGTRQHLVDTDDVEWVSADTEVEAFLSGDLHEVPETQNVRMIFVSEISYHRLKLNILVGADTGGFESFRGQLLVLVGNEVNTQREVIGAGLLTSQIEDTDLRVGNTTVEPGLGVRLLYARLVSLPFSRLLKHPFFFFFW